MHSIEGCEPQLIAELRLQVIGRREVAECAGDAIARRQQLFRHHATKAGAYAGNKPGSH
jgi:hypothetical protein